MPFGASDDTHAAAIRLRFPSGDREVRAALRQLRRGLSAAKLAEDDAGTVELVLSEVLNNVVEHAYGPERIGTIRVRCRFLGCGLAFSVCDTGQALPGLRPPPGQPPNLDCPREDLPEGGFGWYLIRRLTSRLDYGRRGNCNILQFCIPLGSWRSG